MNPKAQRTPPVGDSRWRFARVATAPHRLGFFAAASMMAITALWWAAALAARAAGWGLPWQLPPPVAHALAFTFGFMPLFMVGFLFTAGPRWLALPDVAARTLVVPVAAYAAGWLLALIGFHAAAMLSALGIAIAAAAWAALVGRLFGLVRSSRVDDRLHAKTVGVAGSIGVLSLAAAALGIAVGDAAVARAATQLALWGFVAAVFATVSHRMIPFFTASALPALPIWRPNALLALMLAALGLSGAAAVAEVLWWPLGAPVHAAVALTQGCAAALMLWLAWRWGLVQSLRIRLLAMLHAGFVWLGITLALGAISHALAAGWGEAASLGLAPTHALTMGYLGATLLAMITRVVAGHSGRPLAADDIAWALYLALQAAAVLRLGAALWPGAPLLLPAVAAWAVACTGWAWRYGGWLGRPRVDGRPG
jgi:uncharacterized protein involved in response to NO